MSIVIQILFRRHLCKGSIRADEKRLAIRSKRKLVNLDFF